MLDFLSAELTKLFKSKQVICLTSNYGGNHEVWVNISFRIGIYAEPSGAVDGCLSTATCTKIASEPFFDAD